jgi:hypothetical protein
MVWCQVSDNRQMLQVANGDIRDSNVCVAHGDKHENPFHTVKLVVGARAKRSARRASVRHPAISANLVSSPIVNQRTSERPLLW